MVVIIYVKISRAGDYAKKLTEPHPNKEKENELDADLIWKLGSYINKSTKHFRKGIDPTYGCKQDQ